MSHKALFFMRRERICANDDDGVNDESCPLGNSDNDNKKFIYT